MAVNATLTTTMKSVGEAMAIGRNYSTALQKALRSLEKRGSSFHWQGEPGDKDALLQLAATPADGRIVTVQQALRAGASIDELFDATGIDPWFMDKLAGIVAMERRLLGEDLRMPNVATWWCGEKPALAQHRGQRHGAEAESALAEEMPARDLDEFLPLHVTPW